MERGGYVYILANGRITSTYTGVTSDLLKRVWEHKNGVNCSYSSKYKIKFLVYYEAYGSIDEAILREKQIKKYRAIWKWNLIDSINPERIDLFEELKAGKFRKSSYTK
jgi:putative endonuclease